MADKRTAPFIYSMKQQGQKIVCVTAYDFPTALIADQAGVDLVLVGDSLGNVVLGYESTLPVTMDDMVHHTLAVRRGISKALLVADMPLGSYQSSVDQAVDNAIALVKAGAEAVKLEGAYTEQIKAIIKAGIPVMGHVGMTPQSVLAFGGFKVQGKGNAAQIVLEQSLAVDEAGAFSMVLELIPASLAKEIWSKVSCPTVGIGAGPHCDGQIQVFHDILGIGDFHPKHAKRYAEIGKIGVTGLTDYAREVREGGFPGEEHSF